MLKRRGEMDEVVEYQRRVMEKIKALSLERLKVVLDFIEYLEEKEEWEATLEVLKDEETMENIKAADVAGEEGEENGRVHALGESEKGCSRYLFTREQQRYMRN